jgi:geranylgeranyl pyrophosphate synthase
VLGGRPTVLWALALEGLEGKERRQLEQLVAEGEATPSVFAQIRRLFQRAGAFEKALRLVDEHRARARQLANELSPEALGRLAHYLIDTVLDEPAPSSPSLRPLAVPAR